jgi:hypothetical protein
MFVWLLLEMYSRKFGLRLRGRFGNLLKTADYPPRRADSGCHGLGAVAAATRFGESRELRPEDEPTT